MWNNKQKEADKIIEALIEQVNKSDNEESFKIAKNLLKNIIFKFYLL